MFQMLKSGKWHCISRSSIKWGCLMQWQESAKQRGEDRGQIRSDFPDDITYSIDGRLNSRQTALLEVHILV